MAMLHEGGRETETVMRFAKTWIVPSAQQLINGRTVAIRGVNIAEAVKTKTKGVDLPPGILFHPGAIQTDPVSVPGVQFYLAPIFPPEGGVVVKAVRGVKPSVETAAEGGLISMRVPFPAQGAK